MNIVQLEDDIKSLPDDRLVTEMTNPTGGFPQYLVMSEIKRRKHMREDYQGRMAAHQKTPPRPTMAEEAVQEGISSIMPSTMPQGAPPQGMPMAQGMPVNQPQLPNVDSNIQMNDGGKIEQPPLGILGAIAALKTEHNIPMMGLAPALYEYYKKDKDDEAQEQGMAGGGRTNRVMLGKRNYQTDTLGYGTDAYNPFGYLSQYGVDPTVLGTLSEREREIQERMLDYYSPERRKERGKFRKGMNLVQAGLAVSTARTPEQLSAGMSPVLEGAVAGKQAEEQEEMAGLKASAELSNIERERQLKLAELGLRADYNRALMAQMSKDPDIIKIAEELAGADPKQYGKEIRNEKNEIIRIEPNVEAIKEAAKAVKGWAPQLGYERTLEEEAKIQAQRALVPELFSISNAARAEAQATGGDYDTIYRNKINERTEELIQLYLTGVSPN